MLTETECYCPPLTSSISLVSLKAAARITKSKYTNKKAIQFYLHIGTFLFLAEVSHCMKTVLFCLQSLNRWIKCFFPVTSSNHAYFDSHVYSFVVSRVGSRPYEVDRKSTLTGGHSAEITLLFHFLFFFFLKCTHTLCIITTIHAQYTHKEMQPQL